MFGLFGGNIVSFDDGLLLQGCFQLGRFRHVFIRDVLPFCESERIGPILAVEVGHGYVLSSHSLEPVVEDDMVLRRELPRVQIQHEWDLVSMSGACSEVNESSRSWFPTGQFLTIREG